MPGKPSQTLESTVQELVYAVAVDAATASAIEALPFLALPIINPIFRALVGAFVSHLYEQLSKFVAFKTLAFETAAEEHRYEKAFNDLSLAHQSKDASSIAQSSSDFKVALSTLLRFKL